MTAEEHNILEGFRGDLGDLNDLLRTHIARSEKFEEAVDELCTHMYGVPGDPDSIGVLGRLMKVESKWNHFRGVIAAGWALLLVSAGALLKHFLP